jgi:hypothetical protein
MPPSAKAVLTLRNGSRRTAGLGRRVAGPFLFGLGKANAEPFVFSATELQNRAGTESAVCAKIAPAEMKAAALDERTFPSTTYVLLSVEAACLHSIL